MHTSPTLWELAGDLGSGRTTAVSLTEACLAKIDEPNSQGNKAYLHVDREGALRAARAMDGCRSSGMAPSPFTGIPISVKDLFDIEGQVTRAGSIALKGAPASADAPAVSLLKRAGFVVLGRTNMTEFAFSGLGLNPHFGTPLSPWRRSEEHIAGGSTSGGAVSVADGMAHATLGTDTGGSCRIPAAWCGLVGFKPTAARISNRGMTPLSFTLDSVGTIARSVDCCAALDAILTGMDPSPRRQIAPQRLRLAAVSNLVLDGCHQEVEQAYLNAIERLRSSGVHIEDIHLTSLEKIESMTARGGFNTSEAFAFHRERLANDKASYDPRVAVRIYRGESQSAADYISLLALRSALIAEVEVELMDFDALIMPTTPNLPPKLSDLEQDDEYGRINLLSLRNPTIVNLIDGCAITIPIQETGCAPVGLSLAGTRGQDNRLFRAARTVEKILRSPPAN